MSYVLKLMDTPLLEFDMESSGRDLIIQVCSVHVENSSLLPVDWNIPHDGVSGIEPEVLASELGRWLKTRTIPSNRAYVGSFLSKLGLSEHDIKGITEICKALSLNDCYWVVHAEDDSTFSETNLYDNPFSNILAHIAFTGVGSAKRSGFVSTPELTTNGALAKCWRRQSGVIYLYKEGSIGFANSGNEPYAEYYAAQVADAMGIDHVDYVPTRWKGHFCSKCALFTSKEYGFVSVGRLVRDGGIGAVEDFYRSLGSEFENAFADMIVFDAVICNTDRHFGNFGVLVDNASNQVAAPAPLFDHGLSLLQSAMQDDFDDIDAYASRQLPCAYDDFFALANEVMGRSQKEKLRRLLNFRFRVHPRYNWPEWRRRALEGLIQRRSRMLLG